METKAEFPFYRPEEPALVRAFFQFSHLKHLYRQGWLQHGIPAVRAESVAEHTLGVAVLTMLLASEFPEVDADRAVRIALVHDFGEVYAGDFTPRDHVTAEEKYESERRSVERLFDGLPEADELFGLWEEYERGESMEAKLVRQADRLEMAFQAAVYAREGAENMGDFYYSAAKAMHWPFLEDLLHAVEDDLLGEERDSNPGPD